MRELPLNRRQSSRQGTFGDIFIGAQRFVTGELPWRYNKHGVSCVPCGTFKCVVTYSHRFHKDTYELLDVPGREDIRIHSLNYVGDKDAPWLISESEGCIGLGKILSTSGEQKCLLKSRDAVADFMHLLNNAPFLLTISAKNIVLL